MLARPAAASRRKQRSRTSQERPARVPTVGEARRAADRSAFIVGTEIRASASRGATASSSPYRDQCFAQPRCPAEGAAIWGLAPNGRGGSVAASVLCPPRGPQDSWVVALPRTGTPFVFGSRAGLYAEPMTEFSMPMPPPDLAARVGTVDGADPLRFYREEGERLCGVIEALLPSHGAGTASAPSTSDAVRRACCAILPTRLGAQRSGVAISTERALSGTGPT